MAIVDRNRLLDGFRTLEGGIDSGNAPNLIGPNQLAFAVNASLQGGYVQCRPGWYQRSLVFDSATDQGRFEEAQFQGAAYYSPFNGAPVLVAQIGGRTFQVEVQNNFAVQDLSIVTGVDGNGDADEWDLNMSTREQVWMEQAEDFLVIQDGIDLPLIFNGGQLRRPGVKEVPTGTVMAFAMGRLWVALPDRRQFVASDLTGGPTGSAQYNLRDAVLKFTENDIINEGGAFAVPVTSGMITAMRAPGNLDTSLGQGPLQVFTRFGAFSVNAPFDRTTWKDLQYPIQTISLASYGARAQDSTVVVNGDIWYRSDDGVRSFQIARRDFNTWSNTPLSHELDRLLKYDDDPYFLDYGSGIVFDNRLLVTTSAQRVSGRGIVFNGLASLNFEPVSSMANRTMPIWEGVWTGPRILKIVKGVFQNVERAFAFCLDADDKIVLIELLPTATEDYTTAGGGQAIKWWVETRAMQCGDGGMGLKRLTDGEIWADTITGTVEFNAFFRPDQYAGWYAWRGPWEKCATVQMCELACTPPTPNQPQFRARMGLREPTTTLCQTGDTRPAHTGFEFQAKLEITGYCRISRFRLSATVVIEDVFAPCPTDEECIEEANCFDDLFTYTLFE